MATLQVNAEIKIVETSDCRIYRVTETGSSDLAHVWNGVRVKRVGGQWVDCKNARVELVRKLGATIVLPNEVL